MAFKLRGYQQDLVDKVYSAWTRVRVVMAVMATGAGKTAVFSKIMSDHNGASVAVVHRREIVVQISCSLAKLGVKHRLVGPPKMVRNARRKHLKLFKKSFVDPHALAGVASVQTLTSKSAAQNRELQNWVRQATLMVADECFVAGTLVDGTPIEQLREGDLVTAFDEQTRTFHKRKVVRTFKNPAPNLLMHIALGGRHYLTCTQGHPFWTKRGWVPAGQLEGNDEVLANDEMFYVRERRIRDRYVSRRRESWRLSPAGTFRWHRLGGVQILKRENIEQQLGSVYDGYVYNIEVEGLHTYIANGVTVHNCHHYVDSGSWAKAIELFNHAKLLFVTACPERADGKGLGAHADGYVEEMIEGPQTQWLIDEGYLSPFKYFAPESNLDTSGVPVTASGELNREAMRKRIVDSDLVGNIVDQYLEFSPGKQAIGFANDVATSNDVAAAFQARGVLTVSLCGADDPDKRDRELSDFEAQRTTALLNVDLFDEGFDVPAAVVAMLTRKTESLNKYLQMVGRVLRPVYAGGFDLDTKDGRLAAIAAGPKPYAVVIDPVRNWERHVTPNWPRVWTLDRREKDARSGPSDTVPQKVCPSCSQPYEAYYKLCPHQFTPGCATPPEPAGRSAPDQVAGDLFELDVDGMAALFEKMRAADMSDEDYERDQIARRVPPIGRRPDMKRHQTAKHRRKVLRELVAWWCGLQAGRDMGEVHRRFYIRFAIDIGTAFTLSTKDTDALIKRIQQRFTEDLTI